MGQTLQDCRSVSGPTPDRHRRSLVPYRGRRYPVSCDVLPAGNTVGWGRGATTPRIPRCGRGYGRASLAGGAVRSGHAGAMVSWSASGSRPYVRRSVVTPTPVLSCCARVCRQWIRGVGGAPNAGRSPTADAETSLPRGWDDLALLAGGRSGRRQTFSERSYWRGGTACPEENGNVSRVREPSWFPYTGRSTLPLLPRCGTGFSVLLDGPGVRVCSWTCPVSPSWTPAVYGN